MTRYGNLMGPPPTLLPAEPVAQAALDAAAGDTEALAAVAAANPHFSAAWAALAEAALEAGQTVAGYAYARTGYHRGLDQLRRSGWKGHGPVPWEHAPNQGFLRAVAALGRAADRIDEEDEAERCHQLLLDCDPAAPAAVGLS